MRGARPCARERGYARFVRKHLHLYAPADDGEIEAGPSHVHPELSPFAPPAVGRLGELNRTMLARAAARDEARERWRIGEPYRGADLRTLVARRRPGASEEQATADEASKPAPISQRTPLTLAAGGAVLALAATVVVGVIALAAGLALAVGGLAWAAIRLGRARERLPIVLPLDSAARSVVDAYREVGELSDAGAASLTIEPRESGYLRCVLTEATPEEGARFATALDELVAVADAPRYLVTRPLPDPGTGSATLLWQVLRRQPPFPVRHHPVPTDLGVRKDRAEAFARAWSRHLGPTALVFTQRSDEGRRARAEAAAHDGGYETLVRDISV